MFLFEIFIKIALHNKIKHSVNRHFICSRRQFVHFIWMSPRTLLFPFIRSTFRSAICSHRAQLFLKPLCIYMSASRPLSARERDTRRELYIHLSGHKGKEKDIKREDEYRRKDMIETKEKAWDIYQIDTTRMQAGCNAVIESPKSTRKTERTETEGLREPRREKGMPARRQESATARKRERERGLGVDELC